MFKLYIVFLTHSLTSRIEHLQRKNNGEWAYSKNLITGGQIDLKLNFNTLIIIKVWYNLQNCMIR